MRFLSAVALQPNFYSPEKSLRNLESMPKRSIHVCKSRENIQQEIPREKHWGVLRVYGVDGHVT